MAVATQHTFVDFGRCGSDDNMTSSLDQVLCGPEPSTYIEHKDCLLADCEGCVSTCSDYLWVQDGNAWIKIFLVTYLDSGDRLAEARALAERVQSVLAQKRANPR